jgi:2-dehydro-3-deoxyphosphogalactonate aldolase
MSGGMDLPEALAEMPLVAILRGIGPEEVEGIGAALFEAGFRIIEVPLNSPDPFRSIALLAQQFGERALIGGGTVMTPAAARRVIGAGGRLVVMPHSDAEVIRAAKQEGGRCIPGAATPTEGFAALAAGADALKLFPGETLPPPVLKAWKAVFPTSLPMLPVGGIAPETMADYVAAGADGFGIGSALYRPGFNAEEVGRRAAVFVQAWGAVSARSSAST